MAMISCRFLTMSLVASWISPTNSMTIDEWIFGSVADPGEYFDFFHMTPEGKVIVHTEFDLIMTLEQFINLKRVTRNMARRWHGCRVYYEIHNSLEDHESRKVIKQAMGEWEKYTCLAFTESSSTKQRIVFRDGPGCNSWVGMQDKPQDINLAKGCRTKGVVMHEIGHAVGFLHEQSRPDRDDYIKVNWKVVPGSFYHNFEKYNDLIDTYGVPYDYMSIMHYGSDVINNSLITLDKNYQDKIGQGEGLSFKDIKLANLMYDCVGVMGCKKKDCTEEGFQFYKDYKNKGKCRCWCDSGNVNDPLVLCSDPNRPRIPAPNPVPLPNGTEPSFECEDLYQDCERLKAEGQCEMDEVILRMKDVCAKTCGFCGKGNGTCMDGENGCKMAASAGLCGGPMKRTMDQLCPASCGGCTTKLNSCEIRREFIGYDVTVPDSGGNNAGGTSSLTGPTVAIRMIVALVINLCVKLTV